MSIWLKIRFSQYLNKKKIIAIQQNMIESGFFLWMVVLESNF
jgi:hypothetical protein